MKKSKKSAMEKAKAKEAKLITRLAKKATGKASKNAIVAHIPSWKSGKGQ